MKKTLLLISCILLTLAVNAQNASIVGQVVLDLDTNCVASLADRELGDVIVIAEDSSGNQSYYGNSEPFSGLYSIDVPPGAYTLRLRLPYDHPYQNICVPTFSSSLIAGQVDTINFYVQAINACPLLHIDIGAGDLPDCGAATYTINYYNFGTADAFNTGIEVDFDSTITINSASTPFTNLGGNRYGFNVGTVTIDRDSSQQIELNVNITCNAEPAETHCAKASIDASNSCGSGWNGPKLNVSLLNAIDSIAFVVSNTGNANMLAASSLHVIEDDLMYSQPSIGPLDTLNNDTIWVPTQVGSTYRAEIQQDTAYPRLAGAPIAWSAIEGAKPDFGGNFNTGFYTQYYNDNTDPGEAFDCQQGDTAIAYNNIRLQNRGYDNPGYITASTPLEYQYRFQNVGSQYVSNFVIIDTLDLAIDPSTIILGASNMAGVRWDLEGSGVLKVQFNPLLLPPASVDPENSKGFVNFHFLQKSGNALGTVIENRAAYIFGTDTILTPTVYNTIGSDYIQIVSTNIHYQPKAVVKIYPNPMKALANVEVEGIEFEALELQLFSAAGQPIRQFKAAAGSPLQLHRNSLPAGLYFYRLLADGQPVDSGRVVLR